MSNIKDSMNINEEFMDMFEKPKQSKQFKQSKQPKQPKQQKIHKKELPIQILEVQPDENFKDNIMVFIESSELVNLRKILNIVDKLKR
jgi:hypothetical protein